MHIKYYSINPSIFQSLKSSKVMKNMDRYKKVMLYTALGRDYGRLKQLLYLINLKCKQGTAQGKGTRM